MIENGSSLRRWNRERVGSQRCFAYVGAAVAVDEIECWMTTGVVVG